MKRAWQCDYCGDDCGTFEHDRRLDGLVSCGRAECNRFAADDERTQRDRARDEAEVDDYWRYR